MRPPETLRSQRLVLRRPLIDDAPRIWTAWTQDPDVTRYLSWTPHVDIGQTEAFVHRCHKEWKSGFAFAWLITEEGKPIGMIEARPQEHRLEIGFGLARSAWGRGLMTEAARTVVDWAVSQPDIWRVWAYADVDNLASARVLEKLGMEREGLLKRFAVHPNISPEPRDCWVFGLARS